MPNDVSTQLLRPTRHHDDEQLVVVKSYRGPDDGRAEAQWLAAARHPGVVRIIRRVDEPPVLVLVHVPGPTLRVARPKPDTAARVLADASETLADLHERELVHGAVDPDHILLTPEGVVLCSPVGGSAAPEVDGQGVGGCVDFLVRHWETIGVPFDPAWREVGRRLNDDASLPLRRAAHRLRALDPGRAAVSQDSASETPTTRPLRGFALLSVVVAVTFGAAVLPAPVLTALGHRSSATQRLILGDSEYAIGDVDDLVMVLDSPCPGQPMAILFDPQRSELWGVHQASDGEMAQLEAKVPWATSIEVGYDAINDCPTVIARGAAGSVTLDLW